MTGIIIFALFHPLIRPLLFHTLAYPVFYHRHYHLLSIIPTKPIFSAAPSHLKQAYPLPRLDTNNHLHSISIRSDVLEVNVHSTRFHPRSAPPTMIHLHAQQRHWRQRQHLASGLDFPLTLRTVCSLNVSGFPTLQVHERPSFTSIRLACRSSFNESRQAVDQRTQAIT